MKLQLLRFFTVITLFLSFTTYQAMNAWPGFEIECLIVYLFLVLSILVGQISSRWVNDLFNSKMYIALSWLSAISMSFLGTYVFLSIPFSIVGLTFSQPPAKPVLLLFSVFCTFVGLIEILRGPKIFKKEIFVPGLPVELEGLKLVQISDIHVGPTIRKSFIENIVSKVNKCEADFLFITGDLADANAKTIEHHIAPFEKLNARYGKYYVTGNHEYYWGVQQYIDLMQRLNVTPLINQNVISKVQNEKILIGGITDPAGTHFLKDHQPNLKAAAETKESVSLKILLAHHPGVYKLAAKEGFDLQLSGHTHSGQFFPFNFLIRFAHKYHRGLNQFENLQIYVNQGTGYWGPANRLGVPGEISLLILKRS